MDTLGGSYEAPVSQYSGGRMVGMAGPAAFTAEEARLSLAVLLQPVAAARAGLAAALRWYGDDVDASFVALVDEYVSEFAEGGVGQGPVEAGLLGSSWSLGGGHHGFET